MNRPSRLRLLQLDLFHLGLSADNFARRTLILKLSVGSQRGAYDFARRTLILKLSVVDRERGEPPFRTAITELDLFHVG